MEDLALRPLWPAVADSTIVAEERAPPIAGRRIAGLRLQQRPDGLHPQGLDVEGVAATLCDAVVIDVGVSSSQQPLGETRSGSCERIAGEAAAPLHGA